MPRPRHAVVDLLQEHDIGTAVTQRFDDALGTIAAVDAPDPLLGITVSVRAFKISAGGPLVGSQVIDVDL